MIGFKKISKKRGVTLIELLAAIAILSIVVVGLLPVFTYAMSQISVSGKRNISHNSGRGAVESKVYITQSYPNNPADPANPNNAANVNNPNNVFSGTNSTNQDYDMTLSFGAKTYTVHGFKVVTDYNNGTQTFKVNTFTSPR